MLVFEGREVVLCLLDRLCNLLRVLGEIVVVRAFPDRFGRPLAKREISRMSSRGSWWKSAMLVAPDGVARTYRAPDTRLGLYVSYPRGNVVFS